MVRHGAGLAVLAILGGAMLGDDPKPGKQADHRLPPRVAPIYALARDGSWVEYEIKYRDHLGKEYPGKMWISSVGQRRDAQGNLARWIEIKIEGKPFQTRYGKFLVSEQVFIKGQSLEESILEAYHQEGAEGVLARIAGNHIDYFTMGVRGTLELVKTEPLETKLGKFQCRKVHASGQGGQRPAKTDDSKDKKAEKLGVRGLEYRAWLSNDAPFGFARFEVWAKLKAAEAARMVFSAEAIRQGTGAQSEVDETKVAPLK